LKEKLLEDVLQKKLLRYDKSGEEHFNLISALTNPSATPTPTLLSMARAHARIRRRPSLSRPPHGSHGQQDIGLAEPGALAVTLAAKTRSIFSARPKEISPSRKPSFT